METLLIHKDVLNTPLFDRLIDTLEKNNVKLNSGPTLHKSIKFAPPLAKQLNFEYSDLELTIELVDNVEGAVEHINKFGSSHTDSIVTKNSKKALFNTFFGVISDRKIMKFYLAFYF
jgi:delta-1-pyrroline-5-carboxylate synthetase